MYKFINGEQIELPDNEVQAIMAERVICNQQANAVRAEVVRAKRNDMLQATDWLAIRALELNLNVDSVHNYRQALRDIPMQSGFPNEVTWPALTL